MSGFQLKDPEAIKLYEDLKKADPEMGRPENERKAGLVKITMDFVQLQRQIQRDQLRFEDFSCLSGFKPRYEALSANEPFVCSTTKQFGETTVLADLQALSQKIVDYNTYPATLSAGEQLVGSIQLWHPKCRVLEYMGAIDLVKTENGSLALVVSENPQWIQAVQEQVEAEEYAQDFINELKGQVAAIAQALQVEVVRQNIKRPVFVVPQ